VTRTAVERLRFAAFQLCAESRPSLADLGGELSDIADQVDGRIAALEAENEALRGVVVKVARATGVRLGHDTEGAYLRPPSGPFRGAEFTPAEAALFDTITTETT
jgi:hypothetical protein